MTEPDALSLVNSLVSSRGRLTDQLAQWADERGYDELDALRSLRDAARSVIGAAASASSHPDAVDAAHHLNDVSRAASSWMEWDGEHLVERSKGSPSAHDHAQLARGAMLLARDAAQGAVRPCGAPGCVQFFRVEGHRRRWCSEACGNRARVARHAEQHRGA